MSGREVGGCVPGGSSFPPGWFSLGVEVAVHHVFLAVFDDLVFGWDFGVGEYVDFSDVLLEASIGVVDFVDVHGFGVVPCESVGEAVIDFDVDGGVGFGDWSFHFGFLSVGVLITLSDCGLGVKCYSQSWPL